MASGSHGVIKTMSKHAPVDSPAVETSKAAPVVSAVLHRSLKKAPPQVVSANGKYLTFADGRTILDTTCGAAVACIGSNNERVKRAMVEQIDKFSYCNSMFFGHEVGEQLATMLIQGTGGAMSKAYFMCSGSEAMESAMKLARQYYMELSPQQPKRVNFIAREGSYHGTTLGSLSMSGHVARRSLFLDLLLPNIARVSACNAYRGMTEGQTTEEYVAQLADELDRKFQELGPDTVCAFVAEPVVGAALGCVPAVPGYFKAMKSVCDKYGALLILDEVMSGMGRSGTLHAWQHEDVIPDIQTIAKGLGGGYAPMAGMLINHRVAKVLGDGTGTFSHGHTYQGHPVGCAAALEVQRIIQEEELVSNVRKQGLLLEKLLREHLGDHPYVGNIRGKGLFWGIEFVCDKLTKEPFPRSADVANRIYLTGFNEFGISLYPGTGTKDGVLGDHVLLAPAYTSTSEEIEYIAARTRDTIYRAFDELSASTDGFENHFVSQ
ncbi:Putative aminotransferase class-III, pyridoxal phosphate-dependent transferase, major [Colletotrichum destructivum]|uniref:Aminotransferase class-III, pyridoxal phosphate-dependent transferase, major n=1 Tax=Colletotrichum destructivum TaxID=34406 RepID=A0AAX4J1K5_9PEZI|nr:Putative aminotransferase class-III, pyridoxal phosphate-dependent transferase, major [Colletotrichum destructivum]